MEWLRATICFHLGKLIWPYFSREINMQLNRIQQSTEEDRRAFALNQQKMVNVMEDHSKDSLLAGKQAKDCHDEHMQKLQNIANAIEMARMRIR